MKAVRLRQIWDQNDDNMLREKIVLLAQRIHALSDGGVHEMIANCVSLLTLRTLIDGMIETLVEQEGLDLDAMPQIVGSKYEITIMPRKQN
jgi:hypothetical protein